MTVLLSCNMIRTILIQKHVAFFKRNFSKITHPEVEISNGKLRGSVGFNMNNKQYYKFQGIPYAQPPLGKLRFKPPSPIEPWSGILNCTTEASPSCGGHILNKDKLVGSENCLFLNVYTKNIDNEQLHPVMFEVSGGGFVRGSGNSNLHGPDFLLTEDVVIVTVNFRLGLLGFLCLEDPSLEVFGNMGLKDVVMALKWVQTNICKFGGDPNNVTIFGQSSGGVMVHLLMLSEMATGLFHKAIAQSGCALNHWGEGTRGATKISQLLNNANEHVIYDRLMKLSAEEVYKMQNAMVDDFESTIPSNRRLVGYVVEHPNENAFLIEDPTTMVLNGKFQQVPFITGYTSSEALQILLSYKDSSPRFNTCEHLIPHTFGYGVGSEESLSIASELRKFYFGSDDLVDSNMQKLLMANDLGFLYGIFLTVMNHFRNSTAPVYLYRVSLETELNFIKTLFKINHPGVTHYDEIGYLFKNFTTPKIFPNSREDTGIRRFVKMWTNFAKCGNPTPLTDNHLLPVVWKPVIDDRLDCLDIGESLTIFRDSEELQRVLFLKSLFQERTAKHILRKNNL